METISGRMNETGQGSGNHEREFADPVNSNITGRQLRRNNTVPEDSTEITPSTPNFATRLFTKPSEREKTVTLPVQTTSGESTITSGSSTNISKSEELLREFKTAIEYEILSDLKSIYHAYKAALDDCETLDAVAEFAEIISPSYEFAMDPLRAIANNMIERPAMEASNRHSVGEINEELERLRHDLSSDIGDQLGNEIFFTLGQADNRDVKIVDNGGEGYKLKAKVIEKRAVYCHYRTIIGSPSVNRKSFTPEELERFAKENDGFPFPASEEDLEEFDNEVFKGFPKVVEFEVNNDAHNRSRSNLSEILSLKSKLHRIQAPVKPKFFERLISNVGLSKKSKHTKNGLLVNKDKSEESVLSGGKNSESVGCADSAADSREDSPTELFDDEIFKNVVFSEPELSPDDSPLSSSAFTFSTPSSPDFQHKGIVKQRCQELQNASDGSRYSAGAKSTPTSPKLRSKDLPHSLRYNFCRVSNIGVYSALTRNDKFCQSVMSKGFVKSLVEHINETNAGRINEPDDEDHHAIDRRLSSSSEERRGQSSVSSSPGHSKVEKPPWVKAKSVDSEDIQANVKPSSLKGKSLIHSENSKIRSNSVSCNGESVLEDNAWKPPTSKSSQTIVLDPPPLSSSEKAELNSFNCDTTDGQHGGSGFKSCNDSGCSIRSLSEDKGPPMSPAEQFEELFNLSWSDSDPELSHSEGEESQESDIEEKLDEAFIPPVESSEPKDKLHNIAEEFLKTEKTYVDRLHLLDQVFRSRLIAKNREDNFLPPEVIRQIFSNINSIFTFHNDFLLPELEERLEKWADEKRIGDLMKKNAPFLKMYTEYIKNFDTSMNMINQLMDKNPKFASTVQEIQKLKECGLLTLQHHMLGPIQRVPRYELLLKDYIKHLPEDSPDAKDSQDALVLVTEAASHSNQAMKKIEKFRKLLEIHQSLGGMVDDLVSPTRELIREGKITKISARSGEKQDRYIFLFNDLLLLCSEPLLGTYKIRARLDIDSMEVKESQNLNLDGSFCVTGKQKVVEFYDENGSSDDLPWKEVLEKVILDFRERKLKLPPIQVEDIPENELATRAPCWLKDTDVSMCMKCELPFSRFRRRHHCRSCGKIFCQRCSSKKAQLQYDNNRFNRVCDRCFSIIVSGDDKPENTKKGILQLQADDPSVIASYLLLSFDKGKTWLKRWFAARDNFVLYIYKAHQDVSAIKSVPLPGYIVEEVKEKEISDRLCIFKIHHPHQRKAIYYVQTEHEKQLKKWISILEKMVRLELPDDTQRLSSNSTCSSNSDGNTDTPL